MKRVITTTSRLGGSNTNHPFRTFQSGIGNTTTDWRTITCNGGYVSNLQHNLPTIGGTGLGYIIVPASATDYPIFTDTKITLYSTTSGTIDHNTAGWPFYPDEGSTSSSEMRVGGSNDSQATHRCRVIAKVTTSDNIAKIITINQIAFSNIDISFPAMIGNSGCYTMI